MCNVLSFLEYQDWARETQPKPGDGIWLLKRRPPPSPALGWASPLLRWKGLQPLSQPPRGGGLRVPVGGWRLGPWSAAAAATRGGGWFSLRDGRRQGRAQHFLWWRGAWARGRRQMVGRATGPWLGQAQHFPLWRGAWTRGRRQVVCRAAGQGLYCPTSRTHYVTFISMYILFRSEIYYM